MCETSKMLVCEVHFFLTTVYFTITDFEKVANCIYETSKIVYSNVLKPLCLL